MVPFEYRNHVNRSYETSDDLPGMIGTAHHMPEFGFVCPGVPAVSQSFSSWRNGEGVFDFDLADENVVAVFEFSPFPTALKIVEQPFQFGMFSVGDVPIVAEYEPPKLRDS